MVEETDPVVCVKVAVPCCREVELELPVSLVELTGMVTNPVEVDIIVELLVLSWTMVDVVETLLLKNVEL
jgi:hypothetical protein